MYHTWTQDPLWPWAAAPPLPFPDTTCRIIAELSGGWQGGTVPGLYDEVSWEVSRAIFIPDSAWLYLPCLVGEVAVYVEERLWSVGERSVWVPLLGPGRVRVTLRGHGRGGIIGGAYLVARKGNVAWPIDSDGFLHRCSGQDTLGTRSASVESFIDLWRKGMDNPVWPMWLWGLTMLLWGVAAFVSYPVREAHWRGPWASTPPHPLENVLGFGMVGFFIFLIAGRGIFSVFLAVSLLVEMVFFPWLRVPFEKIWQSWLPVLGIVWVLLPVVPQAWLLWGAWLGRLLMLTLYMPRLAYLCVGSLFFYLLAFT